MLETTLRLVNVGDYCWRLVGDLTALKIRWRPFSVGDKLKTSVRESSLRLGSDGD